MLSLRASLLGLALLAGGTISAMAADLGSMKDDDSPMAAASNARFYLRGDLSYDWIHAPSTSMQGQGLDSTSMGNSWTYGGGVGWYMAPNWRLDVTAEHHNQAKATASYATSALAVGVDALTGPGTVDYSVSSNVVLANLYYDFAGRAGFNPYLGVGLGWAQNNVKGGTLIDDPLGCGCTTDSIGDASQSNFAWALMAGVTRELDRGFSLDVGYRLLSLGAAHAGDITDSSGVLAVGTAPSTSTLYSNEIRVGLRYDIM